MHRVWRFRLYGQPFFFEGSLGYRKLESHTKYQYLVQSSKVAITEALPTCPLRMKEPQEPKRRKESFHFEAKRGSQKSNRKAARSRNLRNPTETRREPAQETRNQRETAKNLLVIPLRYRKRCLPLGPSRLRTRDISEVGTLTRQGPCLVGEANDGERGDIFGTGGVVVWRGPEW